MCVPTAIRPYLFTNKLKPNHSICERKFQIELKLNFNFLIITNRVAVAVVAVTELPWLSEITQDWSLAPKIIILQAIQIFIRLKLKFYQQKIQFFKFWKIVFTQNVEHADELIAVDSCRAAAVRAGLEKLNF